MPFSQEPPSDKNRREGQTKKADESWASGNACGFQCFRNGHAWWREAKSTHGTLKRLMAWRRQATLKKGMEGAWPQRDPLKPCRE